MRCRSDGYGLLSQKRRRLSECGVALLMAMPWSTVSGMQSNAAVAVTGARLAARADSIVHDWMKVHHLPGVALAVVRDGRVVLERGYGTREEGRQRVVEPDTPFQVASITKMLTALAVMRLVEAGRLALDDSVGRYLANGLPSAWRAVTIRQLLGHTSGIASISGFDAPPCTPRPQPYVRGDVLQEVACLPLEHAPGTEWVYGDTGYYLLGMLLTTISGESYETHMLNHVFRPAGMASTRVQRTPPLAEVAQPVRWAHGRYVAVPPVDPMVDEGNGAVVSTVRDLARLDAALDAHRLVSAETRALMWTPVAVMTGDAPYGLGFGLTPFAGRRRVGHTGGAPGCATAFAKYPDDKLTVIVLARGELPPGQAQRLANDVAAGWLGVEAR
jgi:D-alanyl-D-alanine carboxypeptidase